MCNPKLSSKICGLLRQAYRTANTTPEGEESLRASHAYLRDRLLFLANETDRRLPEILKPFLTIEASFFSAVSWKKIYPSFSISSGKRRYSFASGAIGNGYSFGLSESDMARILKVEHNIIYRPAFVDINIRKGRRQEGRHR
jgi:hypothetical protein